MPACALVSPGLVCSLGPMTTLPTPEAVRERLDALQASRGFLLPHHGALAASLPDLHDAYGTMYAALTLTDHHLSAFEREFIWLCILVAGREPVGTHHADAFNRTGGTVGQARVALQLTGYAGASEALAFVERHWSGFFPDLQAERSYVDGMRALAGSVPPLLCLLALAAVHALLRQPWGLAAALRALYALGEPAGEDKLVEALSLVMWPAGVNRFVDACTVWHDLMRTGSVQPSPRFSAWADTPGTGPLAVPDRGGERR